MSFFITLADTEKMNGKVKVFSTALLCFLCTNPFHSKGQSNFSINVKTAVVSSIELVTIQSIRLTKAKVLNNIISVDPLTSSNSGKMIASGTPNSEISISFIKRHKLTHSEGGSTLIFNYSVAGNDVNDQSSSELLDLQNRSMRFNREGKYYFWIGGSVDVSTALPGSYQGEFTLDIEYL